MGLFGHYLTAEHLETIKGYRYVSGEPTSLDRILDHYWKFVVQYVPLWASPNLITFLGSFAAWFSSIVVLYYSPTLTEPLPAWVCFFFALGCLLQQTLDAIDGKQARRTNSVSALGTLFDHGCDTLTSTGLAFATMAICRNGRGLLTFLCVILSGQLIQFLFLWWEYHFHVFYSNPGYGMGVTEAQCGIMLVSLLTGTFGSKFWIFNVLDVFPDFVKKLFVLVTRSRTLQVNHVVIGIIVINNIFSSSYILFNALKRIQRWRRWAKAVLQSGSFYALLGVEWLFYQAVIVPNRSILLLPGYVTMVLVHGTICIRILLASTGGRHYHSFQWPIFPFCFEALALYGAQQNFLSEELTVFIQRHASILVLTVFLWQLLYLIDFVATSIEDLCNSLGISCFSLPPKDHSHTN